MEQRQHAMLNAVAERWDALAWLGGMILKAAALQVSGGRVTRRIDRFILEAWKVSELGLEWICQAVEGSQKLKIGFRLVSV
jgi:hypothetical protein